jgi:hypothetical protein
MQIQAAGMPWFAEDDYEAFRKLLPERSWHPTFAKWRDAAEQNLKHLQGQGMLAVKAHVHSQSFAAWCRAQGHNVDTRALTTFANELLLGRELRAPLNVLIARCQASVQLVQAHRSHSTGLNRGSALYVAD